MNNKNIVIADSGGSSRVQTADLLTKRGYRTYQTTDGAGTLRITRKVMPDLVVLDVHLWGIPAFEVANIIEQNRLSTVLLSTNKPNQAFYDQLQKMNVYAYILRPVQPEQLYQTVEFAIINSMKIRSLLKKVEKLEDSIEERKKVDQAKRMLMEDLGILENEAYKILRKKSMDHCMSIHKIAELFLTRSLKI